MIYSEIVGSSDEELAQEIARVKNELSKMASMEGLFLLNLLNIEAEKRSPMPKSKGEE